MIRIFLLILRGVRTFTIRCEQLLFLIRRRQILTRMQAAMELKDKRKVVILVVDDHPVVAEYIAQQLRERRGGDLILTAQSAEQALAVARNLCIDMAIVDVSLPGMDGLKLIAELRRKQKHMRFIVFTSHDEPWVVSELVNAQVESAVLKSENLDELLLAIESVSVGLNYYSKRFTELVSVDTEPFSARDLDILRYISHGYKSEEIAKMLFVTISTVEYHRHKIMQRLQANNNAHMVAIAMKRGLIS